MKLNGMIQVLDPVTLALVDWEHAELTEEEPEPTQMYGGPYEIQGPWGSVPLILTAYRMNDEATALYGGGDTLDMRMLRLLGHGAADGASFKTVGLVGFAGRWCVYFEPGALVSD
ncbi:MAG: hypothetical protein ABIT01_13285 [Thermoanaerobaculia bacterium]